MQSILDLYQHPEMLIAWGGYTALMVIVFSETGLLVGFFLPGDSLLVTAGLLSATQPDLLDITTLNLLLIPCAILGDATGYWIGLKSGSRIYDRPDSRFFKKKHLLATKAFYEKHGGKTIIIARFMPIIRTFAPFVAGIGKMRYRHFAAYNVVGAGLWVCSFTILGYAFGTRPIVKQNFTLVIGAIIVISVMPGVIEFIRAKMKARDEAAKGAEPAKSAE